ncbi:hypothetical protein ABI59_21560 [Acidobacteria bacterium Mor1]|nr:hypothetical protein ABI59_21560 [Acidobacteria bacterium Mor1]
MTSLIRLLLPLLLCATALPGISWAQDPKRSGLTEKLEVRSVNLEAVVVDKQGNRVQGLGPEDFQLRVGGNIIPIKYFSEIHDGIALDITERSDVAGAPGAPEGAPVPTHYLVFIDDMFGIHRDRNLVLDRLLEQFRELKPDDRVALVAYDGRTVEMIADWQPISGAIDEAFNQAKKRKSYGLATQARLRSLGGTENVGRVERLRLLDDLWTALRSTLRSFSEPRGRKAALLLSGGWPVGGRFHIAGRQAVETVGDTANLLGYTLYPVDLPGRASAMTSADNRDPSVPVIDLAPHDTLATLAERTGGKALLDGARLASGRKAIEDTRSYYWIGFTPDWKQDNQLHRVKLEVLRPGLEVRTRRDFIDRSKSTERTIMAEAALMFDRVPGALPLEARFGEPRKVKRRTRVTVDMQIPMDQVVMLPGPEGHQALLELRVAVLDNRGDRNDIAPIPVVINGPALPDPGAESTFSTEIELRSRQQRLILTLHDTVGDALFVARTSIDPRSKKRGR